MSSLVEQIKSRVGILDVVESYVTVEKKGTALKARCPFHNERTPSFFVSPARGSFYCFGCNKGGDVFTFIQEIEGVDFKDALKTLATRAGIEVDQFHESRQERDQQSRLRAVMDVAAQFYEGELNRYPAASAYVRERGITEETAKSFQVGYAPDGWRHLADHLTKRGFNETVGEEAGLLVRSERGWYDRFRNRIMFPIADGQGRVVAFSGRVLPGASTTSAQEPAKYINSPETPIYSKSATLYGFDRAKVAIRKSDRAILVEGQMDLVLSHQAGVTNAVAVSGTALTPIHLRTVGRLCHTLHMAFDQDVAGFNAARRGIEMALIDGFDVRLVALPHAKDPADLIRDDPKRWRDAVNNAEPVIDAVLAHVATRELPDGERRRVVEHEVLPYVARLESALDKAHYVSLVADFLHLPEEAVGEAVVRQAEVVRRATPSQKDGNGRASLVVTTEVRPQWQRVAERIAAILAWQTGVSDETKLGQTPFVLEPKGRFAQNGSDPVSAPPKEPAESNPPPLIPPLDGHRFIRGPVRRRETPPTAVGPAVIESARKRLAELIGSDRSAELSVAASEAATFEAELAYGGHTDIAGELDQLFHALEETLIKDELTEALGRLRNAEKKKEGVETETLLARCGELSKRLHELRVKNV